ncbi:MAG: hypothetical protein WA021_01045 [Minisyncoccia bacterium]
MEYGLIAALIAIGIIATARLVGDVVVQYMPPEPPAVTKPAQ